MSTSANKSSTLQRRAKLMGMLAKTRIDAVAITSDTNRLYFSGFTGSNGVLVISIHGTVLITDARYTEQAQEECLEVDIVQQVRGQSQIRNAVKTFGVEKLGIEADQITYSQYFRINEEVAGLCNLVPLTGEIDVMRSVKDPKEIRLIEKAIHFADLGMNKALDFIEQGVTEKEVAWALEKEMRDFGADGLAFDSIVATGRNAARPHHRAGDSEIKKGDPVVVDIGAIYGGYRSDISRTIYVGPKVSAEFTDRYDIVLRAQSAAISFLSCGMTGDHVDRLARDVIDSSGYKGAFTHGLGHGVGLKIHERPMIVPGSEDILTENMIFTIEPGIYFSDWGGIRLEDVVILEKEGARVLTQSPKVMEKFT